MSQLVNTHVRGEVLRHISLAERPLIVILGPTASGKTAFSVELALMINQTSPFEKGDWKEAEIINADSRQLYRQLNIGTAKTTPTEMKGIPHHLIDIVDPDSDVTAAWYKEQATAKIKEIQERKNVPLLVGGSMLYLSAVIDDLRFASPADPKLRKKLEEEYDRDEGASLYRQIEERDPQTAQSFHRKNKPYVIRAAELLASGKKPSAVKKKGLPPFDLLIYGMEWKREELNGRINSRTHQMLENGWVEEVEGLMDRGYSPKDPGMKSEGYREIMAFLRGDMEKEDLEKYIAAKTRQYAKRQMTWWGKDQRIRWISISSQKE